MLLEHWFIFWAYVGVCPKETRVMSSSVSSEISL